MLYDHETFKLHKTKPVSIADAIEKAKSALEKGELNLAFNALFDLYFLETYAGSKLHSVFEFKNFLKYLGPGDRQESRCSDEYLRMLDPRMIKNLRMFAEYHERLAKADDNVSALVRRIRVRSLDEFKEKWNLKMKKWSELVLKRAEKQEKIRLGQELGLSDDEEGMPRSSNEYSLIDNSFDTQNEKEKTEKAAT